MNFFEALTNLYTKSGDIPSDIDTGSVLVFSKTLSQDRDCHAVLKRMSKLMLYLPPRMAYGLMFLMIPKKTQVPYLKFTRKKKEEEADELLKKIQTFLGWSDREMQLHSRLLERTILKDKKHWKAEFGISDG